MVTHSAVIFTDIINTSFVYLSVKFQLQMSNVTKVMNARRMSPGWFKQDLDDKTANINTKKHILSTCHSSHVHNFSYL